MIIFPLIFLIVAYLLGAFFLLGLILLNIRHLMSNAALTGWGIAVTTLTLVVFISVVIVTFLHLPVSEWRGSVTIWSQSDIPSLP